ncbi:MAG TPA: Imm1 family immunity protein [Actinokineospora sp.]|jgi:hypothetical protein|nr:Imm1 family immunity protein [Actinokineospora sp.]
MTIEARYRTLIDGRVGEEVLDLPEDGIGRLREALADAPFGVALRQAGPDFVSELVVGVQGDLGAIYFTDESGSWYTAGPTPDDEGPVYAEVDFPGHSELPASRIMAAVDEYLRSGVRPACVPWQVDPYQA